MKIFAYSLSTLVLSLMVMSFITISKTANYHTEKVESVYKTSLNDLTPEEKQEAFEYFITTGDCTFKGIKLNGKVKYVTSFPDIKIQYVTSFPDIKVRKVTSFPNKCGEWQIVESFPDFTVQIVTSFPDLKVQLVESFPGMK